SRSGRSPTSRAGRPPSAPRSTTRRTPRTCSSTSPPPPEPLVRTCSAGPPGPHEEGEAEEDGDAAQDRPFRVPGHERALDEPDALADPHRTGRDQGHGDDYPRPQHGQPAAR